MSEKNEFDFEKDQNTNIDVTGGTDMDTNENENSVLIGICKDMQSYTKI